MGKKIRDEDLVLNIIVNGDRGKKEITQLEKAIKDTNSEIREMEKLQEELRKSNKKETEEYKAVTAAIKQKNQAVDLANNRLKQLKNGLDLNSMSLSDLKKRMAEISRLRNIANPGTEEWIRQNKELEKVQQRYRELKGEALNTGKGLEGMVSGITAKVGVFAAGLAAVGISAGTLKKVINDYAQFEDKLADVMKTTGLTKDEVEDLNSTLAKVNTRTSQEELLGLARVAGKLGIQGQEDILGFVRAADKIGVALSEDLGGDVENAIREVGKLVDIFNVRDEFGIEEGLNKVGSVINALGQASTANEAYIVDFTKRLAGIAPAAGISISNVMGLASTMDQLGQSAEVSGTTFVNLIPKMFQETAEFARIANIDVQEFSDLLNTDANEAMIRLLEGVRGNEGSMRDLVMRLKDLGLDGARATAVVSVLANNTQLLRKEQSLANLEFQRGTSLTDEFAVKNENLAASVEKINKFFSNLYKNSWFRSGIEQAVGATARFLTSLQGVEDSSRKLSVSTDELDKKIPSLTKRYEELTSKTNLNESEQEELRLVIDQLATLVPNAVTEFDKYGTALGINTGKVREFTKEQKALSKFLNSEDIQKANSELRKTEVEINKLLKALNTRDKEGNLIQIIEDWSRGVKTEVPIKLNPEQVAKMRSQLASLQNEAKDLRSVIAQLSGETPEGSQTGTTTTTTTETPEEKAAREAREKAAKEEAERRRKEFEAEAKRLEAERQKELERQAEFRRKTIEGSLSLVEQEKLAFQRRLQEAGLAGKNREQMTAEELQALEILEADHYRNLSQINSNAINDRLAQMQYMHEQELRALRIQHNEEFKEIDTMEKARAFLRGKMSDEAINNLRNMSEAQRAIDKVFLQEEEELIRGYLESLMAEMQRLASAGILDDFDLENDILSEEEKQRLLDKIEEVKLKLSELGIKSSVIPDESMAAQRSFGRNVDILGFSPQDWETFFENLQNAELSGGAMIDTLLQGAIAMQTMWQQYNAFVSAGEQRKLQEFERNSRQQQDILKRQLDAGLINQDIYNQQVQKLNADLDRKRAVYERNQAKRERNVALMSAIVNTAAAVAKSLPNLFLAKIVGAFGALQIGTILKTPLPEIPGAADGGFLEDVIRSQDSKRFRARREPFRRSYVDRPTVIVGEEGTEFVANNRAVRNPTIKPVLDAIDTAQRNGSIDTLNLFKILEQNRQLNTVIPGRRSGGTLSGAPLSSATAAPASMAVTPEIMEMVQNNNRLLQLLLRRFSRPIKADVSLIGKGSLEESQEELSEIQRSANI